jgi:3-oxoadipate enol-lactonase
MDVDRGRAPLEDTELYYEVTGEGPWMVLAHGGAGTRIHWWQQVAALRREYRCVTYDARGFGASPPGHLPPDGARMRHDLSGLLDHLHIDRAVLVGHSMGGMAVSGVAQTQAERVRGLVMSDTAFGFATAALSRWAGEMIGKVTSGWNVLDNLYADGFEARRPDLHYLYGALNRITPRSAGPQGLSVYETWRDRPPVDYRDFAVPSLFIVGTSDRLTVPWLIRETVAAVGGARLVEIEEAGHSAYAEQAEAFNTAVLDFCRSLP